MSASKDRTESYVPSWDGSSKTWRRYVKEISWYVGSTKVNQRQYLASKLISRLSGSARLLAMSWHQRDFDGPEGVNLLLQRLSASPLVRRSLPNAAAIMSEYFSFRRRPGEGISQFLVRESLGFEEFQEALVQLKEEKDGIDPSSRNFGLPDMSPKGDDDDQWGDWRRWRQWQPPTEGGDASVDQDGDHSPTRGEGYRPVPTVEPDLSPAAASVHGRTVPPASQPGSPTQHGSPIPGVLGPLDSFILEVLRGWRLLVAASLSNEEWRDVLATTGIKLDWASS